MPGFSTLVEISEKLKGSVPVFHPEALLINFYSGNWKRAYAAVRHLSECLTSGYASQERCSSRIDSHVPQILLSNYFEGFVFEESKDRELQWSSHMESPISSSQFFEYETKFDASNNTFSSSTRRSELHTLVESIEKKNDLAAFTDSEKLQILAFIDLLTEIQQSSSAYENLDAPGRRFWVALRFQQLHFRRSSGKSFSMGEMVVDTSLIKWGLPLRLSGRFVEFFSSK